MINQKTKPKINTSIWVNEWKNAHRNIKRQCPTIGEAMQSYIDNRLSFYAPATLHFCCYLQHQLDFLSDIYIDEVDSTMLQSLIDLFAPALAAHEIQHIIRFLMASLKYAGIDEDFKLNFPANYRVREIERS